MNQYNLNSLVSLARRRGASDLHLDGGLPAAIRVNGQIKFLEEVIKSSTLKEWTLSLLGAERWDFLNEKKSIDLSETLSGMRCRINAFFSLRGVSLAIRILNDQIATIDSMNLHPVFRQIASYREGLVLMCGTTGSGKSTTLSALIQEINKTESLNVITIENPIEYVIRPVKSMVRQRELGISVDSFHLGVRDALREDPDVIMVGEVRDEETAKATISAAETGHLVLGTIHGSNCAEAIQRLASLCHSDKNEAVFHQISSCLKAVVCQKLVYFAQHRIRVPVCEILIPNTATRSVIFSQKLNKISDTLASSRDDGSMTFQWYREWVDSKSEFYKPSLEPVSETKKEVLPDAQKEQWKLAIRKRKLEKTSTSSSQTDLEISGEDDDLMQIIQDLEE